MIPALWLALIRAFGCRDRWAYKMWGAYDCTSLLLWQLAQHHECRVDQTTIADCMHHLSAITPVSLIQASLAIAPEGKLRSREAVHFEEAVLQRCDCHGRWK